MTGGKGVGMRAGQNDREKLDGEEANTGK
jgi:hypothetical protein